MDEEKQELLDVLAGVIAQACTDTTTDGEDLLDSMALSYYADGIRMLAKHGMVAIEFDVGRRVVAKWVDGAH